MSPFIIAVLVPLLLSGVFIQVHSQLQTTFILDVFRPMPTDVLNRNSITLECTDDLGIMQENAVFFRDNRVIPSASRGSYLFVVTYAIEGDYACGTTGENNRISRPRTIVGKSLIEAPP